MYLYIKYIKYEILKEKKSKKKKIVRVKGARSLLWDCVS